jgi:hypothetical protein
MTDYAKAHDEARDVLRRERLAEIAKQCLEVYEAETAAMLDGRKPTGRYALLTSEGSPESAYRDNPNLIARDDLAVIGEIATSELHEGWGILSITDLDTGDEIGWSIKVDVG